MISKWLEDLAGDFWELAGEKPDFPRDLDHVIHCTKPVFVTRLAGLRPSQIHDWLAWRRLPISVDTRDRPLNGCLVASEGQGFIFVEEALSPEDDRLIVAHEFAHFLADYEHPRERARRRLGPSVMSIFDGQRPPEDPERIEAALAGVALGAHVHFMERTASGTYTEPASQVEQTANDLALELIAPWRTVLANRRQSTENITAALQDEFGLPASWAGPYAQRLSQFARGTRSFSETLGWQ